MNEGWRTTEGAIQTRLRRLWFPVPVAFRWSASARRAATGISQPSVGLSTGRSQVSVYERSSRHARVSVSCSVCLKRATCVQEPPEPRVQVCAHVLGGREARNALAAPRLPVTGHGHACVVRGERGGRHRKRGVCLGLVVPRYFSLVVLVFFVTVPYVGHRSTKSCRKKSQHSLRGSCWTTSTPA